MENAPQGKRWKRSKWWDRTASRCGKLPEIRWKKSKWWVRTASRCGKLPEMRWKISKWWIRTALRCGHREHSEPVIRQKNIIRRCSALRARHVTPSVRNMVALLAWSASHYSLFLSDKSSLHLPRAALGCVTVNSACCAAHGKRLLQPRRQVRFSFRISKKQVKRPALLWRTG